jgi:hypothetical protein
MKPKIVTKPYKRGSHKAVGLRENNAIGNLLRSLVAKRHPLENVSCVSEEIDALFTKAGEPTSKRSSVAM